MRIIGVFWLLIACFCMAVLSQVGDESLSRNLKCSVGNFCQSFYHWDVHSLTLKDVQCGISYLGSIIYHFGSDCWLSFLHFVHVLQSSLIMSMIITLYYFAVALLACDIFYTTIIKPRFFLPEERRRIYVSDNEIEDAGPSNTSSTISIHMLFELNFMNHESSANLNASHSNAVWKAENCEKEQSLDRLSNPEKQRRLSFSASGLERWKERHNPGLRSFVRLCKSLSSLSIDGVSRGSSNTLNTSSFNLSTHSSIALTALSRGSHDLSEITDHSVVALSRGSHDPSSIALSQYSQQTVWTMYSHPVPGSITSSNPHQHQLQRSEREYVFVQRPFVRPLPWVNSWLKNNFFGSRASNRASSGDPGIITNRPFSVGQDRQRGHNNRVIQSSYVAQDMLVSQDGEISGSWARANQSTRDACYLINNQKTEVVLCGIPADTTQDYFNPMVELGRSRTWGSMIELHHKPKWSRSSIYKSLPNVCKEFGLKNRVAFNVEVMETLNATLFHPSSSIEEKDEISCDDNMDSISVVCQKIEKRDQALRDAARAKFEQNIARKARRLRLFRQHEEIEATRPAQVTRSSFIDVLKKETYKQVFVPLFFHAGKEILLSALLT